MACPAPWISATSMVRGWVNTNQKGESVNTREQAIKAIVALGRANNHILHQQLHLPGACETMNNMGMAFDLVNEALDSLRSIVNQEEVNHVDINNTKSNLSQHRTIL